MWAPIRSGYRRGAHRIYNRGGLPFPIKPVVIKGVEISGVLFLHPFQVRDLKATFGEGGWGTIYQAALQGGQITGNPINQGGFAQ